MKNILKKIVTISIIIFLGGCVLFFILAKTHPKIKDCGVVTVKDRVGVGQKHGIRVESLLGIQFENSGFMALEVSETLYLSKNIGDRVCFDLDEDVSIWYILAHIIGLLTIVITIIVSIIWFVTWLFDIEF